MNPPLAFFRRSLVSFLMMGPAVFAVEPDTIQTVEKAASEWVKMRAETVRLAGEWAGEQVLLASTVDGLKERAQSLEEKRDQLATNTAAERTELEMLEAKRKAAADESRLVEERMGALSARLLQLRPTLPPRLSDALEMSFRSLADSELGAGQRMQLAMTVLNRCAQFNRGISHGEEVLTLAGEPGARTLEVIYWGLSHGYALDRAAGKAWIGSPGAERWEWEARADAAPRIAELIAIYTDKADPAFVTVPAHAKKTFATTASR